MVISLEGSTVLGLLVLFFQHWDHSVELFSRYSNIVDM